MDRSEEWQIKKVLECDQQGQKTKRKKKREYLIEEIEANELET